MDVKLITDIEPLLAKLIPMSDEVFVASAYINKGAVQSLMQRATAQGKHKLKGIQLLCGLDVMTNPDALRLLQEAMAANQELIQVRCVPHRPGFLFHPKVYFFKSGSTSHLIVGSGNLTTAGHFKNQELYCYIECESNNEIARAFRKIGDQWFKDEFSTPLAPEMVETVSRRAALVQEVIAGKSKVDKAMKEIDNLDWPWIVDRGRKEVIQESDPWVPVLRGLIDPGYIINVHVSLRQLRVPIPMELIGRVGDAVGAQEGKAIVVVANSSAYVKLLPSEAMSAFESLRRDAENVLRSSCLELNAGWYVPPKSQPAVQNIVNELGSRHAKLLTQYIKRVGPIRDHLKQSLKADLEATWITHQPGCDSSVDSALLKKVTAILKERQEQLRNDLNGAVPFNVTPTPHPAVTMLSFPDHAAWKLQERVPETELVSAVLDMLSKQMDLINGITYYRTIPSRKKRYEQARLLICIEGEITGRLMRRLARSLKPRERSGKLVDQKSKKKVLKLDEEMKSIRDEVMDHQNWLKDLQDKTGEEVLTELKKIGYQIGRS